MWKSRIDKRKVAQIAFVRCMVGEELLLCVKSRHFVTVALRNAPAGAVLLPKSLVISQSSTGAQFYCTPLQPILQSLCDNLPVLTKNQSRFAFACFGFLNLWYTKAIPPGSIP